MTLVPKVEYGDIRFTPDHIAILDCDEEVVTIPLESIRALTLERGFTAERPLPEALLGLACCLLAALALRRVVWWLIWGGTLWDVQILLLLLLPLGVSLLRHAVRRGFYLLVEINHGVRKFAFVGGLDQRFPDVLRQAEALSRKTIDWRRYPSAGR